MSLIFKSKLLRAEIKHWILILCLSSWAITASVYALSKEEKIILVGIDDAGTRLITNSSDRLLQSELKNFLTTFFQTYYVYDSKNFLEQMGHATEMMSDDLWERNKDKLFSLHEKLVKNPLSQTIDIDSIDLLDQGRVEAILLIKIKTRLNVQSVRLKVNAEFRKHDRTDKNPWGFEITEVSDAVI